MSVCVIDYGMGNIASVMNSFRRLEVEATLSSDPEVISSAQRVVLPGVGHAARAMSALRERELDRLIPQLTQPVLGICLGLQILCTVSEEGDTPGLGVFPLRVRRFREDLKVPHVGWNTVEAISGIESSLADRNYYYFVHSYFAELGPQTTGQTTYGENFSAVLERDNFYGVQFHPEKSGAAGLALLERFLKL